MRETSSKIMTYLKSSILVFLTILCETVNADTAGDIRQLKNQVKALQDRLNLFSSYCQLHAAGKCGPCICRDDYRIPDKYFCDCRNQPVKRDCLEHRQQGHTTNGVYTLTLNGNNNVNAYCDQTTDGGGWTVIQRRVDGSLNFYRRWVEYKVGFGQRHHEYWLGNENIHLLTTQAGVSGSEAMVQYKARSRGDRGNTMFTNRYKSFRVEDEQKNYLLHVTGSSGEYSAKYFESGNNGMEFSTYDRDNDGASRYNCAQDVQYAGWWINGLANSCTRNERNNINGPYDEYGTRDSKERISWGGSIQPHFTEMKVRRL